MSLILLSPSEEIMCERIAALLNAAKAPVLTLTEAIAFTKHGSDAGFYRWCEKWNVTSCAQGRYSRVQLDRALHRESLSGKSRRNRQLQKSAAA